MNNNTTASGILATLPAVVWPEGEKERLQAMIVEALDAKDADQEVVIGREARLCEEIYRLQDSNKRLVDVYESLFKHHLMQKKEKRQLRLCIKKMRRQNHKENQC